MLLCEEGIVKLNTLAVGSRCRVRRLMLGVLIPSVGSLGYMNTQVGWLKCQREN
jgi:hypothetical protein